MSLKTWRSRLLSGFVSDPRIKGVARAAYAARHALTGAPRQVEYFHQVDDPYCALTVQVLERLIDRHDILLVPRLVGPPPAWATPDRARWERLSRQDARRIAAPYGLTFTGGADAPDQDLTAQGQQILAGVRHPTRFTAAARAVTEALWRGDADAMASAREEFGAASPSQTRWLMERHGERRESLGHYLGATFSYDGEWYWGIDRLHYLEDRLIIEGASEAVAPLIPPRYEGVRTPPRENDPPLTLEMFASLRSPYTYLALGRARRLAQAWGADFQLRPVLPMVMRGLAVPRTKSIYIVRDARREAERLEIPFGRVTDPVGDGIERGLAIICATSDQDERFRLMHAMGRAVFVDELDLASDRDLRAVVTSAGLMWPDAQKRLRRDQWRAQAQRNREALLDAGAWGVPSFRVNGGEAIWGQDRLWMVEDALASAGQR